MKNSLCIELFTNQILFQMKFFFQRKIYFPTILNVIKKNLTKFFRYNRKYINRLITGPTADIYILSLSNFFIFDHNHTCEKKFLIKKKSVRIRSKLSLKNAFFVPKHN